MAAGWDADRYQRQFGFVSALGTDLLELLDPRPGETVLDLGCGTGELAAAIQGRGARVWALDADAAMVAAAGRRLGGDRVLAGWLAMFGRSLTAAVPADRLGGVLDRTTALAAPRLRRHGRWEADYWRLRFVAVAEAAVARPAKLLRQASGERDG